MKRIWVGVSLLVALIGFAGTQAQFVDIAKQAGLNDVFLCGSDKSKKYIIETLGGGVALFDYNNDGYLDAFFVTGSALEGFAEGREPTNQLYRNNRDGTFARVTKEAGLVQIELVGGLPALGKPFQGAS